MRNFVLGMVDGRASSWLRSLIGELISGRALARLNCGIRSRAFAASTAAFVVPVGVSGAGYVFGLLHAGVSECICRDDADPCGCQDLPVAGGGSSPVPSLVVDDCGV